MPRTEREREYRTRTVGEAGGGSLGVTLPAELQHTDFPYQEGAELRPVKTERGLLLEPVEDEA